MLFANETNVDPAILELFLPNEVDAYNWVTTGNITPKMPMSMMKMVSITWIVSQ
eukprot:TRINITY_DN276_c0_g1_i1.p1 TRINITY_DN276_c0_g1~~TRINITY_DN276_c0_g1_i1.p1  ORF type:complete len:54 (-),score=0.63 TRINITY_DN276_c0_g1_i1:229-390(-)